MPAPRLIIDTDGGVGESAAWQRRVESARACEWGGLAAGRPRALAQGATAARLPDCWSMKFPTYPFSSSPDDIITIAAALAITDLNLLAITTVFGNVPAAQAALNVAAVPGLPRRLPVNVGAHTPLNGVPPDAGLSAHGSDGLGDCGLVAMTSDVSDLVCVTSEYSDDGGHSPPDNAAVAFIAAAARSAPLTILALGPLTNIALALRASPDIFTNLHIVWFGGSYHANGTRSPAAETNALADPEAADAVFASGCDVTAVGFNVTKNVVLHAADLKGDDQLSTFLSAAAGPYMSYHADAYKLADAMFMHDPSALVALLQPSLFTFIHGAVVVETVGPFRGLTAVDDGDCRWAVDPEFQDDAALAPWLSRRPARVAVACDAAAVKQWVVDRLKAGGKIVGAA
jgi:inosine-uridine nucleoside N-ribohydrolase